ncbi:MAG: GtrA family protein [Bacilli bacterium]|nr:GtrA family protein [Bacilli bacterium]
MNKDKIKTFIRNIISSLLSAVIDISLFHVFSLVLERKYLFIVLATVLARIISGIVNFSLNRNFVFKSNGRIKKEFLSYLILFVIVMVSSSLIVAYLSMKFINTNQTLIKLIVDLGLFIISFTVQDRYIFKERKNKDEEKRRK